MIVKLQYNRLHLKVCYTHTKATSGRFLLEDCIIKCLTLPCQEHFIRFKFVFCTLPLKFFSLKNIHKAQHDNLIKYPKLKVKANKTTPKLRLCHCCRSPTCPFHNVLSSPMTSYKVLASPAVTPPGMQDIWFEASASHLVRSRIIL